MKLRADSPEKKRPRWFLPAILGAMLAGLVAPQAVQATTVVDKRIIVNSAPSCAFGEAEIERTNTIDLRHNSRVRTVAKGTVRVPNGDGFDTVCNMGTDGSYAPQYSVASKMVGWIRVDGQWSGYWQTVGDNGDGWSWRGGRSDMWVQWKVQEYLGPNPPLDFAVATAGGHKYVNGGEFKVFTWAGV